MIKPISIINFKPITPNYNKGNIKSNSLKEDAFVKQKNINPSFGGSIIPKEKIFKCCDKFIADIDKIEDAPTLMESSNKFIDKIQEILDNSSPNISDESLDFLRFFRHGLINNFCETKGRVLSIHYKDNAICKLYPETTCMTDIEYLTYQKQELRKAVIDVIKERIDEGIHSEIQSKNNKKIVQANTVFDKLLNHKKRMEEIEFRITGRELLEGKKVKNPVDFYWFLQQPFLNAAKYSEGKSFKIVIEKIVKEGNERYYASFINPETKVIPDTEINKILKGNGYRASNAIESGIRGTGFGFISMIGTLKRNGYKQDIPNLIEKGREKGVCVRIPLIGLF